MTTDREIGERLHVLMRRRGLTGVAAAAEIGVNQSTMSKKLRGDRPITLTEMLRLCAWLDVPVSDVLDGISDPAWRGTDSRCDLPSEFASVSSQVSGLVPAA